MITNMIQETISNLPPKLQLDLIRYIELLHNQKRTKKKDKGKFKFNWEGGIADLKNKYSSVELQHKSLEWR